MNIFLNKKLKKNLGFTVIELLVVISIISVLSSLLLAVTVKYITKSKISRVQADTSQFIKVAYYAEGQSNSNLIGITGNTCSECLCYSMDLRNISTSDPCYVQWQNNLSAVQTKAGTDFSAIKNMLRDPWGSPYLLDENEREFAPSDCRLDTIKSAGPDGIDQTSDDISYDMGPHIPCP